MKAFGARLAVAVAIAGAVGVGISAPAYAATGCATPTTVPGSSPCQPHRVCHQVWAKPHFWSRYTWVTRCYWV